jgi:hypothetical protein
MKNLEELQLEYNYHQRQCEEIYEMIKNHSDTIQYYFNKLELNDNTINDLTSKVTKIEPSYSGIKFNYEEKRYEASYQIVEKIFTGLDVLIEDDINELFLSDQSRNLKIHLIVMRIFKIFLANKKKNPKIINELIWENRLRNYERVAVLLFINYFIDSVKR